LIVSNKELDLMDWEMQTSVVIHRMRPALSLFGKGELQLITGCSDPRTNREPQSHVYCAINGVETLLRG
jgi:hypothetical protein